MEESAPNVVPPTPPVTSVPPSVVGMPLIERDGDHDRYHLPRSACEAAGREGTRLIGAFFGYHSRRDMIARRLVLATPMGGRATSPGRGATTGAKRKATHAHPRAGLSDADVADATDATDATDADVRRTTRNESVPTCGATFGCTLGIIVAYLEGRGIPAERAHVLRSVRTQLLPAAESLRYMRGVDAQHLALGMASCRVVHAQRTAMPEMGAGECPRIDHKYGHAGTAVGATATLIAAFGVMSGVPNHCRHFVHDHSLAKALRCAAGALDNWKPAVLHLPEEHWEALSAERRALHRASLAVREAIEVAVDRKLEPSLSMNMQLAWARMAAFPSGELVNEYTQTRLCERIRARTLFGPSLPSELLPGAPSPAVMSRRVHQPGVLPLSEIPAATLMPSRGVDGAPVGSSNGGASDTQSCASSSWQTMSSGGSNFSHVSQDSLSGLVESFGAGGVGC